MHGALPPALLGVERWPEVPLPLHYAEKDPWLDAHYDARSAELMFGRVSKFLAEL